jgi:hypothetical protein
MKEKFMLVTFTTKYHADIIMFGDIGVSMLKMMGHSGTVPGAILADDVAAALASLQTALTQRAEPIAEQAGADEEAPVVSISKRALPLIELLNNAIKEQRDVTWR